MMLYCNKKNPEFVDVCRFSARITAILIENDGVCQYSALHARTRLELPLCPGTGAGLNIEFPPFTSTPFRILSLVSLFHYLHQL